MGLSLVFVYHHCIVCVGYHRRDENETKMNTVVSTTTKTSYQSVGGDEESATLILSRDDENVSTTSKKSSSSNGHGVSLKTVAYGLGVVALACSGSFVAGRSAARYKLAQQVSTGMGVVQSTTPSLPRLGKKQQHSTAHSMAAAKKKMSSDESSPKEEEEAKTTDEEPADPET